MTEQLKKHGFLENQSTNILNFIGYKNLKSSTPNLYII